MTLQKLTEFLKIVDRNFPVPLSAKVDLTEYAKKLIDRADLVAELSDTGQIQSLAAGYISSVDNNMAYLAVVATLPEVRGQGKAKKAVREFMTRCRLKNRKGIHLYAVESNVSAVNLYKSLGFERYFVEDEPRADDLHLVYWFDKENRI